MTFDYSLTLIQFITPIICAGLLFGGLIFFIYLAVYYRSLLYFSITFIIFVSLVFVSCETFLIIFGAILKKQIIANHIHRIKHTAGNFCIFGLIFIIANLLKLNKLWKKVNYYIVFSCFIMSLLITMISYIFPDFFLSLTTFKNNARGIYIETDYGKGQEGILYLIRDITLGIITLYSFICMIIDSIINKRFTRLLLPFTGIVFAAWGAAVDIIFVYTNKYIDIFPDQVFSRASIGLTIMLLFLMINVTQKFISYAKDIENVTEKISMSEKKYKTLAEGTEDCIFSLDNNYNFIFANNRTFQQLDIDEENLKEKKFYDILYIDDEDEGLTLKFINSKLNVLKRSRSTTAFKARLKAAMPKEPKEYHLHFNYVKDSDNKEIIVKAKRKIDDITMEYIDRENLKFVIDDNLIAAEEISSRLVLNLHKYLDSINVNSIRLAIRAIIVNVIELKNEEPNDNNRETSILKGNLLRTILNGQKEVVHTNKILEIEQFLNSKKVIFKVKDMGYGYSYKKIIDQIEADNNKLLINGSGFILIYDIFDKIKFNEKEHQVTLTRYFK